MKSAVQETNYESPIVEVIEVEIERGFVGSNVENPIEGEESDW